MKTRSPHPTKTTPKKNGRFPDTEVSHYDWSTDQEPLRGSYFHRVRDGELDWQGFVVAQIGDFVLLQLFSWLTGEQSSRHLVPITDLVWRDQEKGKENGYLMYGRRDDMIFAYEEGCARCYRSDLKQKQKVPKTNDHTP